MTKVNFSTTPTIVPVQQHERIHILDILRGFAVFGILAVNISGFASPSILPGYLPPDPMPLYDALGESVMRFLAEGKFYTIFAFLFGLGFSVQLSRAEAKGANIRSFYPRRLWVLFGFGILHALFFWMGDILRLYALLGFALLAFRKRSNRTLLTWAIIFFILSFFVLGLIGGPAGGNDPIPGFDVAGMARQAYTSNSFLAVVIFQAVLLLPDFVIIALAQGLSVMALFLLGLLAGKSQLFEQLEENRTLLKRTLLIGFSIGLAGNSVMLLARDPWLASLGFTIGAPALSAAYVSALALLSLRVGWLSALGNVGRMALSNYVLQSIVCSFLFNGYGLGLYDQVGMSGLWGIVFAIFAIQIPLSNWWLERFQFGPLEWIWRSLTYRQLQPMRRPLNRVLMA